MSALSRERAHQRASSRAERVVIAMLSHLEDPERQALRTLVAGMSRSRVDAFLEILHRAYGPAGVLVFSQALGALLEVLGNGITVVDGGRPRMIAERDDLLEHDDRASDPWGSNGLTDPFFDFDSADELGEDGAP